MKLHNQLELSNEGKLIINNKEVLELIIKRFKIFSSFPVIEIFCFWAIVFLFLFQPLKVKEEKSINEN